MLPPYLVKLVTFAHGCHSCIFNFLTYNVTTQVRCGGDVFSIFWRKSSPITTVKELLLKSVYSLKKFRTVLGASDFAVSCAVVWNSLPTDLRVSSLTVATFARHLKAYLFHRPSWHIWGLFNVFILRSTNALIDIFSRPPEAISGYVLPRSEGEKPLIRRGRMGHPVL